MSEEKLKALRDTLKRAFKESESWDYRVKYLSCNQEEDGYIYICVDFWRVYYVFFTHNSKLRNEVAFDCEPIECKVSITGAMQMTANELAMIIGLEVKLRYDALKAQFLRENAPQ